MFNYHENVDSGHVDWALNCPKKMIFTINMFVFYQGKNMEMSRDTGINQDFLPTTMEMPTTLGILATKVGDFSPPVDGVDHDDSRRKTPQSSDGDAI